MGGQFSVNRNFKADTKMVVYVWLHVRGKRGANLRFMWGVDMCWATGLGIGSGTVCAIILSCCGVRGRLKDN